jgi:hypothetical protein
MKAAAAALVAALLAAGANADESHHMIFEAKSIPHESQRYDTVGDWRIKSGQISILVSSLPDERYEFLVALHELVEAYLCKQGGISEETVTAFDTGPGKELDEPGDDPRAPYHAEHVFASKIERMMADELGVDWEKYETAIEELGK